MTPHAVQTRPRFWAASYRLYLSPRDDLSLHFQGNYNVRFQVLMDSGSLDTPPEHQAGSLSTKETNNNSLFSLSVFQSWLIKKKRAEVCLPITRSRPVVSAVGFPLRALQIRNRHGAVSLCVFHTGGSLPTSHPKKTHASQMKANEEERGQDFYNILQSKDPPEDKHETTWGNAKKEVMIKYSLTTRTIDVSEICKHQTLNLLFFASTIIYLPLRGGLGLQKHNLFRVMLNSETNGIFLNKLKV